MSYQKVLVILGPTATGKTDLALILANKFNGELVSCDSRQIYRGLDIGTGKYPNSKLQITKSKGFWEIEGIRVWMYDVISPKKQYTVADYVKNADRVIRDIGKRGKLPIVVGGSGLYLKALLEGLPNLAIPIDRNLRKELEILTLEQLQMRLKKLSPERWNLLNDSDRQNKRRLVRHIELVLSKANQGNRGDQGKELEFDILKIGLTATREIIYKKADKRVIERINQGMVEESQNLHQVGLSYKRMKQLGLEYGVLADYLQGKIKSKEELIEIMQNKIHGYIRRQLTWFKREKDISFFDITKRGFGGNVEKKVAKWYHYLK